MGLHERALWIDAMRSARACRDAKACLAILYRFGLKDRELSRLTSRSDRRLAPPAVTRLIFSRLGAPEMFHDWPGIDNALSLLLYLLQDGTLSQRELLRWMRSRNSHLGWQSPLDTLGGTPRWSLLTIFRLAIYDPPRTSESTDPLDAVLDAAHELLNETLPQDHPAVSHLDAQN